MQLNLEKAREITGWMSNSELEWLAKTARKCEIIIEFGSYYGRSTRALADNSRALIFAVDPWTDEYYDKNGNPIKCLRGDSYQHFKSNLFEHIMNGTVEMLRCKSSEFPMLVDEIADLVFIDADHRYEFVKADIELAEKLVKKNGIIAGHDYTHDDWPGVKQAVDEKYPTVNQCGSIWWITKT